jgi:O-6-methylguanine DNA methyltransferase
MINDKFLKFLAMQGGVHYSLYKSPVGFLYLLGTDSALHAIVFKNKHTVRANIEKLFKQNTPVEVGSSALFLDAYFNAGRSKSTQNFYMKATVKNTIIRVMFNSHSCRLDLSEFTQKEIAVYMELLNVQLGKTISYHELSEKAGIPSGARFVGNTMAKNMFPIMIPCHRVIKSGGAIGNYSGGIWIKESLLNHESRV